MDGDPTVRPRLTVALACESDALGGAEMVILRLAESLRGRGHRIVGIGPDEATQPDRGSNGWLRAKFLEGGFEWRTYRKRRGVDPLCLLEVTRLVKEVGADVVHSHEFAMAIYGTAAARLAGRPHVISMHGNRGVAVKWKPRVALRWAFAHSRASVAVSHETRVHLEDALGLEPGRLHVVQNGVPERPGDRARGRAAMHADADEIVILAVGSLIARKNHELLMRALAALPAGGPRWRLGIAGTGALRGRLEAVAAELGVSDRVHLLGPRDDIPDLLAGADVFAMPSDWEGLPLALLEAMFARKAVVATAVAGIPEAIESGVHGLLVPPGDRAAMTAALHSLLTDATQREALGRNARERASKQFSIEAMTDAYERLYRGEA
jgi:glycosyltransferase involved in cell wall biosynthesis